MKIGFIGAGNVGTTMDGICSSPATKSGCPTQEDRKSLSSLVEGLGEGAEAGTKKDAINCDVVVLVTHWVQHAGGRPSRG